MNDPRTLRCLCCDSPEPESGWHSIAGNGTADLEAYCSQDCFMAHEGGLCPCFADEDFLLADYEADY